MGLVSFLEVVADFQAELLKPLELMVGDPVISQRRPNETDAEKLEEARVLFQQELGLRCSIAHIFNLVISTITNSISIVNILDQRSHLFIFTLIVICLIQHLTCPKLFSLNLHNPEIRILTRPYKPIRTFADALSLILTQIFYFFFKVKIAIVLLIRAA